MEVPATPIKEIGRIEQTVSAKKEEPNKEMPITNAQTHEHNFVPLWMPIVAFALILIAYAYCAVAGIPVNAYRAAGILGISGLFAVLSIYKNK